MACDKAFQQNSEDAADIHFMTLALQQAQLAAEAGEVPVGAVVVRDGVVLSSARNSPIHDCDPTAHAEIVALRAASQALRNYRLDGCTVYVTLEPCAMCAGAMLHARVARVVVGTPDPKTGAAGSVIHLFSNPLLNHQTEVRMGVLQEQCAQPLQSFFQSARRQARRDAQPLREDALRTPSQNFDNLPDYPWDGQYVSHIPALNGLRMHYLDEGPVDAETVFLCLHGNPAWSYLYRKLIPVWVGAGHRVVAPDLIGFGKSDKPKRESAHSFDFHREYLLAFIEHLNLRNVVLVVQDWGGILGLTLPMGNPQRYKSVAIMNTLLATGEAPLSKGFLQWREMCNTKPQFDIGRLLQRGNPSLTESEAQAYRAPFPDKGFRAALRAFPNLVPDGLEAPGAEISRDAQQFWMNDWQGKGWMGIGAQDPVLGTDVMLQLHSHIRNCAAPWIASDGGHFLQELGPDLASTIMQACV